MGVSEAWFGRMASFIYQRL